VTRLALRANAAFGLLLGLVLLAATWDGLFDALRLPHPEPEVYAQLAGALLAAFAYLLWIAPRDTRLTQGVAAAMAIANGLAAAVLFVWLLNGSVEGALLWLLVPLLSMFALAEAWIASRSAAMLMPGD
jgi:hypothetical protein